MADVLVPGHRTVGGEWRGPGVQTILDAVTANGDSDVFILPGGPHPVWVKVSITGGTATVTLKGTSSGTPTKAIGAPFTTSDEKTLYVPPGLRFMATVSGISGATVSVEILP